MKYFQFLFFLFFIGIQTVAVAQPAAKGPVDPFDYGKMWTFEHAPVDYFADTYGFRPDEAWLKRVRMASLRFATYCSASFISPDGLILTNHHCSEGEVFKVMNEEEDFDANGFYAASRAEERQVPGLFVKQLVNIADITDEVDAVTEAAATDAELVTFRDSAFQLIKQRYADREGWQGLELETVTYYSGGKYSLYGYKRYDDIRLVLIPEQQLGFFGGDPDNFTYPRYNLDFTLWRAYEDGEPVNTTDFHFPVNPQGAEAGELVFAIGNPGSTERYRTMAQLEYDRDYRYPALLTWLTNRLNILEKVNEAQPSEALESQISSIANGVKAYTGILAGLNDEGLMSRKRAMEDYLRSRATGNDYWEEIAGLYANAGPKAVISTLLSPSPISGNSVALLHYFVRYVEAVERSAPGEDVGALRDQVVRIAAGLEDPTEEAMLTVMFQELQQLIGMDEAFVREALDGRSPEEAAGYVLQKTKFSDPKKLEKLLDKDAGKLRKSKDPIARLAFALIPQYQEAQAALRKKKPRQTALEKAIGNEIFQIYGLSIPPDATFTLRLADGIVKSYDYNGTEAPVKTTYFGLYDRYHSQDGVFPWSLPERWLNPPMALLQSPLNFISTTDSIGGSSGSPMINRQAQLIGLLFDGNIESLSGNFIYDTAYNRSVGVHAGGITASLRHIYQAQRLLEELGVE